MEDKNVKNISDINEESLKVKMISELGENNSFINVSVHFLYQIHEFRDFILNNDFPLQFKYNMYYELKIVFDKYYKLSSKIYINKFPEKFRFINNTTLKKEIIDLYNNKFVVKDPIDVIYIYINSLHNYILDLEDFTDINENECDKECLAHNLFFINLVEQSYCLNCNFMGDFFKVFFCNFFYEINADALIYEINKLSFYDINDKLFELEKLNYSKSKNIKCYENCSEPNVLTNRIAITSQKYLITTINFNSKENRTLFNICNISFMIPFTINNEVIFTIYDDKILKNYYLQSIIVKENNDSYSIIMFDMENISWYYYNDMNIMKLKNPNKVIELIIQKQLLPILLLYVELTEENKDNIQNKMFDQSTFENYIKYSIDIDKGKKTYIENEDLKFRKIRPDEEKIKSKMEGEELKKVLKSFQNNISRRKNLGADLLNEEKILYKMMAKAEELEEEKNKEKEDDKDISNKWKCEKCNKYNKNNIYRCTICNTFNYEAYNNIINNNNNDNIIEEKKDDQIEKKKKKRMKKNLKKNEYNFTFNPSENIKCWKCGFLNPYYKIKCNKCRYRINDAEAPTIISIFKPYSERSNIIKKDKYIDFSIEDNNASDSFWICSYCKCKNNKSKFCAFCFKNRNFNLI